MILRCSSFDELSQRDHREDAGAARRGDYRVLFALVDKDHILYVRRIDHRSDVYTPNYPNSSRKGVPFGSLSLRSG